MEKKTKEITKAFFFKKKKTMLMMNQKKKLIKKKKMSARNNFSNLKTWVIRLEAPYLEKTMKSNPQSIKY
jgi:hypothetical protein